MRKLTQAEFIERANKVHNGKYDYSKVEYINAKTKVCIICPIHGEFWQTPNSHLRGVGCSKCGGSERLTTTQFINRSNIIHNNYYNYKKTLYQNSSTKVVITCPIHGDFEQLPMHHLKGSGCFKCCYEKQKKLVFGVGINDADYSRNEPFYIKWKGMIERCYSNRYANTRSSYKDCYVNEQWHILSNFKRWFDEYNVKGWHLDKDILVKGNKEYAPDKCCFVPLEINELFTKRENRKYPVGVTFRKGRYIAQYRGAYLGIFNNKEEAFNAYKEAKEKRIKEAANKWKDQLEPRVYEAMCNYQVEIDD